MFRFCVRVAHCLLMSGGTLFFFDGCVVNALTIRQPSTIVASKSQRSDPVTISSQSTSPQQQIAPGGRIDPKTEPLVCLRRTAPLFSSSRSQFLVGILAVASATLLPSTPQAAHAAKADCFTDCYRNCKIVAPKDDAYCQESCRDYCEQPDRHDGLSGSVSADKGEVGILGGSFGTGTVVKGQDKPPTISLPGLDFSSGAGKKLIGY